ncbi:MAG: response regulator, partial [Deltaproteobacteria bacterium]|nr:response regulator [Deltaproteobacteria bacterium]
MSAKIRILYIDDYELDRELVRDSLEKEHGGFELMEASNKQEYETLLRNHEFDLVLSDFNIAGFEGLQVIEAVRVHNPRIPVIIVTGTG